MDWTKKEILKALDQCAQAFTFPMLDNGYVYLAAARMSAFRSRDDWALVIEVFGYSPRAGDPNIQIYTFSNNISNRSPSSDYVTEEAHRNYLKSNPFNDTCFVYPIDNSDWMNDDDPELTKIGAVCILRGNEIQLPAVEEYNKYGISLEGDVPLVFEFCRYLAATHRNEVLCTDFERRRQMPPNMNLVLQLDEWRHPDLAGGELPSSSETFNQIATAIVWEDKEAYHPSAKPNTHWSNWPEGGTL